MRIAVYTDYQYRRDGETVYADKAFAVFLAAVAESLERTVVVGRLRPEPGRGHYPLPAGVDYAALPWYPSLAKPRSAGPALLASLRRLWRVLDEVDGVWILGPHVIGLALALMACLRRRRVVLGVRQDLPRYVRSRHPGAYGLQAAAVVLESTWRLLALACPVITVGPDLARRYRHARRNLQISVSMVRRQDLSVDGAPARPYDRELRVLSVGRLEPEKAPLLLPEILAALREDDPRWRMSVCGEGPLRDGLMQRASELSVAEYLDVTGYVPIHDGLLDRYRESQFFLHVSLTEGLPQVLHEAFATRTPVVATAVGGVPGAAEGCALLIPPGDPASAVDALRRLLADPELRERLVEEGFRRVAGRTMEDEAAGVARFLAQAAA